MEHWTAILQFWYSFTVRTRGFEQWLDKTLGLQNYDIANVSRSAGRNFELVNSWLLFLRHEIDINYIILVGLQVYIEDFQ